MSLSFCLKWKCIVLQDYKRIIEKVLKANFHNSTDFVALHKLCNKLHWNKLVLSFQTYSIFIYHSNFLTAFSKIICKFMIETRSLEVHKTYAHNLWFTLKLATCFTCSQNINWCSRPHYNFNQVTQWISGLWHKGSFTIHTKRKKKYKVKQACYTESFYQNLEKLKKLQSLGRK